jgi:hypothetical protein
MPTRAMNDACVATVAASPVLAKLGDTTVAAMNNMHSTP